MLRGLPFQSVCETWCSWQPSWVDPPESLPCSCPRQPPLPGPPSGGSVLAATAAALCGILHTQWGTQLELQIAGGIPCSCCCALRDPVQPQGAQRLRAASS